MSLLQNKIIIHASSNQIVTKSMDFEIKRRLYEKINNITTPDTVVHINVKDCYSKKTYYKISIILECVNYTIQVKSSKEDFYAALDDVTDKLKDTIYKRKKKMVSKKRRGGRPASSHNGASSILSEHPHSEITSLNGVVYDDIDYERKPFPLC